MRPSILLLPLATVIGCQGASPRPSPPPVSFDTSPFATSADTVAFVGDQAIGVYHEVLRFYQPGQGKARWLDRTLLPRDSGQADGGTLDAALAASLVERLGTSFCLLERRDRCRAERGGELRLSPIYGMSPERARVAVRYTSVDPYAPDVANTQVLLLERKDGRWKIRSRGPAEAGS